MFLLDECLWPGLATALVGLPCRTVAQNGWSGLTDAEVIARSRGVYDAILTSDRRFGRSGPLTHGDPAIILLRPKLDRPDHLLHLAPKILEAVKTLRPGSVIEVRWWE